MYTRLAVEKKACNSELLGHSLIGDLGAIKYTIPRRGV